MAEIVCLEFYPYLGSCFVACDVKIYYELKHLLRIYKNDIDSMNSAQAN